MSLGDHEILVLAEDIHLGQLLCDMIRMYRLGLPQLSMSEADACQILEGQGFDMCILEVTLRGRACDRAVAAANARGIPVLLLSDGGDLGELSVRPRRGLVVDKPANEEDIRFSVSELLRKEPAG